MRCLLLTVVLPFVSLVPGPVFSGSIVDVDQSFQFLDLYGPGPNSVSFEVENHTVYESGHSYREWRECAQTFVVGQSGRLSRLDLWGSYNFHADTLAVDICKVNSDGSPAPGDVLGSVEVSCSIFGSPSHDQASSWAQLLARGPGSVNLRPADIRVKPGDRLAMVLRAGQSNGIVFRGHKADESPGFYPPGEIYVRHGQGSFGDFSPAYANDYNRINYPVDLAFRSWIETNPVAIPEPRPALLLLVGLAVAMLARPALYRKGA